MGDANRRVIRRSNTNSSFSLRATDFRLGVCLLFLSATPLYAYDVNDKLSIGFLGAATTQCQEIDNAGPDECKQGYVFQPEISFNDDGDNSAFVKLGFARRNALNPVSPFALAPWAADMEDDVENINGRNRDHVLTAWYRRRFHLPNDATLAVTGGIINAADYLDDNAFANDEFGQFMNEAFVNAPTAFLPAYDRGGVVELDHGPWSLRAVVMQVGENDDGRGYNFYGGQVGYILNTARGEGTYRVIVAGTDDKFLDSTATRFESLSQITFSADQQISKSIGLFLRIGWQDDAAAVTHQAIYSGGLNINGNLWGRANDTIGIGYAHLEGGNSGIDESRVAEAYYRLNLNDHLALTADIQLLRDEISGGGKVKGAIFSLRGTKEF